MRVCTAWVGIGIFGVPIAAMADEAPREPDGDASWFEELAEGYAGMLWGSDLEPAVDDWDARSGSARRWPGEPKDQGLATIYADGTLFGCDGRHGFVLGDEGMVRAWFQTPDRGCFRPLARELGRLFDEPVANDRGLVWFDEYDEPQVELLVRPDSERRRVVVLVHGPRDWDAEDIDLDGSVLDHEVGHDRKAQLEGLLIGSTAASAGSISMSLGSLLIGVRGGSPFAQLALAQGAGGLAGAGIAMGIHRLVLLKTSRSAGVHRAPPIVVAYGSPHGFGVVLGGRF